MSKYFVSFEEFVNEKKVMVKRKYRESKNTYKMMNDRRMQIFEFINNNEGSVSYESLMEFIKSMNEDDSMPTIKSPSKWVKNNSDLLKIKETKNGKSISLSERGKRLIERSKLNEDDDVEDDVELITDGLLDIFKSSNLVQTGNALSDAFHKALTKKYKSKIQFHKSNKRHFIISHDDQPDIRVIYKMNDNDLFDVYVNDKFLKDRDQSKIFDDIKTANLGVLSFDTIIDYMNKFDDEENYKDGVKKDFEEFKKRYIESGGKILNPQVDMFKLKR